MARSGRRITPRFLALVAIVILGLAGPLLISRRIPHDHLPLTRHSPAAPDTPTKVITVHSDPDCENIHLLRDSLNTQELGTVYNLTVVATGQWMPYHSKFLSVLPVLSGVQNVNHECVSRANELLAQLASNKSILHRDIDDDEIILVIDGNDMLFFPCSRDLKSELAKFDADLVLTHATGQYPDWRLSGLFPPPREHDAQTSFPSPEAQQHFEESRFLNSAAILCRAWAYKYFLSERYLSTLQLKFAYPADTYTYWDDQQFWTQLFLAQNLHPTASWRKGQPKIAIDYEGLLCQHFNSAGSYTQDPKTRYVYAVAGHNHAPLYKHEACLLQASGGDVNYGPMFKTLYPRWKDMQADVYEPSMVQKVE